MTRKGKGYGPAEADPIGYHGVPRFDPNKAELPNSKGAKASYSQIFGDWLCDMAARDPQLMAITPAMREGSGMVRFSQQFPRQYFDVAIAEQHAVTLAAGMACDGLKPVVAIYSTFLQRGYDQLIHDVALQDLPVLFAIDRAGVVGADGPTHQGAFDLSYLRCIPNMVVMCPSDENECRQMLYTGFMLGKPAAVRYPRGSGPGALLASEMSALPIGKARVMRRGQKLALLCFGTLLQQCHAVAESLNATLIDMRFVKPLDEALLAELASSHSPSHHSQWVTVEENAIAGGAGSAVNEWLHANGHCLPVLNIGLPDEFIEHGAAEEILHDLELDSAGIANQIARWQTRLTASHQN